MTAHDRTRLRLEALADQWCSEAADLAAKLTPTQLDELQLGRALMRHIGFAELFGSRCELCRHEVRIMRRLVGRIQGAGK